MIVARLWADHVRECDPIATIEIAEAPLELVVPSDLGLNAVYTLRSKVVPDWTGRTPASADYEFDHIA
ncbi:hypothetical protein [Desertimonas flava]|uniref:hypothetical protein n=1 Tax=Desertimonas flava TaxID=2064846 RepID=UPI000E3468B5|nr:hypothetical protein [Desertimonas flava]